MTGDVLTAVARVAGPVAIDPRPQEVPWSVPLRSKGPSGPAPQLSDAQLATVEQALLAGATANGLSVS